MQQCSRQQWLHKAASAPFLPLKCSVISKRFREAIDCLRTFDIFYSFSRLRKKTFRISFLLDVFFLTFRRFKMAEEKMSKFCLIWPLRKIENFLKLIFFSESFTFERWWVRDVRNVKRMGVTYFVLERTCPGEHLNLSNSSFVSEGHSGCKSQNILIRALKGNVLCRIWFKWTY